MRCYLSTCMGMFIFYTDQEQSIPCLTLYSFSTENKESLVQHQKQVEELPGLEQSLNAQDDVFLPLEPTHSAGVEPIATLVTRKGQKCVFLVRTTSGIPLLPKERVSQIIFALK